MKDLDTLKVIILTFLFLDGSVYIGFLASRVNLGFANFFNILVCIVSLCLCILGTTWETMEREAEERVRKGIKSGF